MFIDIKDAVKTEVIRLRMNGEWKEYAVEHTHTIEHSAGNREYVESEELFRDVFLHPLMFRWPRNAYIVRQYFTECLPEPQDGIFFRYNIPVERPDGSIEDFPGTFEFPIVPKDYWVRHPQPGYKTESN